MERRVNVKERERERERERRGYLVRGIQVSRESSGYRVTTLRSVRVCFELSQARFGQ